MPHTLARMRRLRTMNRTALLVSFTILLWAFDLGWDLVVQLSFTSGNVALWPAVIGPRVVQHLLLLPILAACYMAAMRVPTLTRQPLLVLVAHASLAFGFASLTRMFVFIGNLLVTGSLNAAGTGYSSIWQASFAPAPWLSATLVNFMVYLLGLFFLIGLVARLDLEEERLRTVDLYNKWLDARLETLRGQLNPHFLFNSLHTISSLLLSDPKRADRLLADFSDVLRITLRDGQREFATVREELDYARRYLSIEETRFEDRLVTRFVVEEACLGARVPSLILQPLIENAIKYGISNSAGSNCVVVEAKRGGDTLMLEVSNDFRCDAMPVGADRRMGIGLNNVRERLTAIYGTDYILTSDPLPRDRWSTRICVPFQQAG